MSFTQGDWGVLLDLDQTLVLTHEIEKLRNRRAWAKVYESLGKTTLPPGTTDFVANITRLANTGIVTMSPRTYAQRLLLHHGLQVKVLVAYHDVSQQKPNPEPILEAARRINLRPHRCFHIGDTPADIEAAHRAGAIPIEISWDAQPRTAIGATVGVPYCRNWNEVYGFIIRQMGQTSRPS